MNALLDLSEVLNGHEGESFYTTAFGYVQFLRILSKGGCTLLEISGDNLLTKDGKLDKLGECIIFPSRECRDWNKWISETEVKTPKIWSEVKNCNVCVLDAIKYMESNAHTDFSIRSAIALLKIHYLIEIGYGGNITKDEWMDKSLLKFTVKIHDGGITKCESRLVTEHISFRSFKCREEFLSYSENVKLIKEFYSIS